jgi:hypothetical protein
MIASYSADMSGLPRKPCSVMANEVCFVVFPYNDVFCNCRIMNPVSDKMTVENNFHGFTAQKTERDYFWRTSHLCLRRVYQENLAWNCYHKLSDFLFLIQNFILLQTISRGMSDDRTQAV